MRKFVKFVARYYDSPIVEAGDLDHAAACYLSHLADDGVTGSVGATFMSELLHFLPEVHGSMPLMARSLKSFRRLRPTAEGEGFSEEMWLLLLAQLIAIDDEAFLVCATSVDCFMRGDEWEKLHTCELHHALVGDRETLSLHLPQTKCGVNEGVNVERDWIRPLLVAHRSLRHRRGTRRRRMFGIARSAYAHAWKQACDVYKLDRTPHAARHTGATLAANGRLINGFHSSEPLAQIQARGRWAVPSSVRRYAKPHVLARVNAVLTPLTIDWARKRLIQLDTLGRRCTLAKARVVLADPPGRAAALKIL